MYCYIIFKKRGIMKKVLIILVCLTLFTTGCFNKKDTYIELSYEQLEEKITNKDSFILVIGSSQCTHCASYKTTMTDIVKKYKIDVYYIDIYQLSDEKLAKLNNKFVFTGTPTTVFVDEGKEKDPQFNRIDGAKDFDYIVEKLKKNKYID